MPLESRIRFSTPGARNVRGQFAAGSTEANLRRIAEDLGKQTQLNAVRNLNQLKRPGVSTGRLRKATADPENLKVTRLGFSLGIDSYLDGSIAKYWRTIEEGSARTFDGGFVGKKLYGQFRTQLTGFYDNRWGRVPASGGPLSAKGARDGKFRPFGPNLRKLLMERGFKPAVVQHEIEGIRYYERAYQSVDPGRKMSQKLLAELRREARATISPGGF